MSVLVVSNERQPGDASGQVDAYRSCVLEAGVRFGVVRPQSVEYGDERSAVAATVTGLESVDATTVVVLSVNRFPSNEDHWRALDMALRGRFVIYWEGDAWGGRKAISPEHRRWLSRADLVLATAGRPLSTLLRQAGARRLRRTIHTYDQKRFTCLSLAERSSANCVWDVIVVANATARARGVISRLPGDRDRVSLVRRLRRSRLQLGVYGSGWPRGWSMGRLAYAEQVAAIRRAKVSANWDHFPDLAGYSSDRLPISLVAGRPHVTTWHPEMAWADDVPGLFLERSVSDVVARVRLLLALDPSHLHQLGENARAWALGRVSHRQAAQYVLSHADLGISVPPLTPWCDLAEMPDET